MFTATLITIAVITMGFWLLFDALDYQSGWPQSLKLIVRVLLLVTLFASVYCILAGIHLAVEWQNPFSEVDPNTLGSAAVKGRGRGGIIILVWWLWPWVLMAVGGWNVYKIIRIIIYRWIRGIQDFYS